MNKLTIGCVALCCAFCLGISGYTWMNQPKTAYVNLGEVFENFTGKKELAFRLDKLKNQQKSMLDSMELTIHSLQKVASDKKGGQAVLVKLQNTKQNYQYLNAQFNEQYQTQDASYSEKVWKQINQYVTDYGKDNDYDFIYGTNGNGSLMYGSSANNITEEIINHINERYEGL
jgi:Outer membrane protein